MPIPVTTPVLSGESLAEYFRRIDDGEQVDRDKFIADHAQFAEALRSCFADEDVLKAMVDRGSASTVDYVPNVESRESPANVPDTGTPSPPVNASADAMKSATCLVVVASAPFT